MLRKSYLKSLRLYARLMTMTIQDLNVIKYAGLITAKASDVLLELTALGAPLCLWPAQSLLHCMGCSVLATDDVTSAGLLDQYWLQLQGCYVRIALGTLNLMLD